jgi:multidrug efflux pump subunit AcrA (membrane-fusion protein)
MNNTTRKNIISAGITVLILFGGLMIFQMMSGMKKSTVTDVPAKNERRKVQVSTFESQKLANIIEIDGRLRAHEQVTISSKVTGVMEEGKNVVKEGNFFRKGQLLFAIDNREATYDLKALKSNLQTSITQMMPDLKFDYAEAFQKWEKYLNGFEVDHDLSPFPEPDNPQEKYYISGKGIYNQYYNIKSKETKLKDYHIYAPFSGVVTQVNVFPGALISIGTSLATMINTSYYEFKSPVPLEYLQYVKVGQVVTLISDDLEKSWKGKISRIGTQIDENTQNIPLYVAVSGSGLKDGMYLRGEITGMDFKNVIELPKQIFLSPKSVYVVKDSILVEKTIESVKRRSQTVIVTGLGPDEMVVTGSLAGLYAGQKVNY